MEQQPKSYYICGPYSADTDAGIRSNIAEALVAGSALINRGIKVIIPHVAVPSHYSWERAMKVCFLLLGNCQCLVLLPGWERSNGASIERQWALDAGIPVVDLYDLAPELQPMEEL